MINVLLRRLYIFLCIGSDSSSRVKSSGAQVFLCFGIKTWGNEGASKWWLLWERGFLRRFPEQRGLTKDTNSQ